MNSATTALRVSAAASRQDGWRSLADVGDDELSAAAFVLVDGSGGGLGRLLTRIHRRDPALQPIVVTSPGERATAERTLLFTPGLGEVWLLGEDELDEALFERAARVTEQRRRYRHTHQRVQRTLGDLRRPVEARALASDSFLAALLEVVPDLVIAVDAEERVISANHAAERVLGRPDSELEGLLIGEVLQTDDTAGLELLLRDGGLAPRQGEIVFQRPGGGEVVAEVTVAPVLAGLPGVRCMVVHDVSEDRRIRGELERQAQALDEQASYLEEQTAEYEMVNHELHERTDELEQAIEARSRFYAGMSHELRTPLNAIIGYNALLLDGVLGELPEFVSVPLRKAQHASHHLLELVNDILDLAKIEAGKVEVQIEDVRLPDLLGELLDTVRPLAEQHGAALSLAGGAPLSLRSDPRRMRQILLNLLSNALKYGGGRPVRIGWAKRADGQIELSVTDQGPGLSPEQVERIFDEFVQFDTVGGGTGLGLTISRRLAEVLGGRLEVESMPGEGSTFRLLLPEREALQSPGAI